MARTSWLTSTGRTGRGVRIVGTLIGLVGLLGVTACTGEPAAQWGEPGSSPTVRVPGASLTFSHSDGATDVSPGLPVSVQVIDGTLDDVSLVSGAGPIEGQYTGEKSMWRSTQELDFATSYTMTVKSTGLDGKAKEESRTFTTVSVKEGYFWNVYFPANNFVNDINGGTFGVGQVIIARFDDKVDKAVAERSLTVTTNPPVEGSWYWIDSNEAHWRPQTYWAAGTTVTVEAKVLGVAMQRSDGRVLHGQKDKTMSFKIGQSRIAKIDNNTKQMQVFIDGAQVKTIPVSLGKELTYVDNAGTPHNWRTTSGPHIVTEKHDPVIMRPAMNCPSGVPGSPGCDPQYYVETVYKAVRISDQGIYVHAAPWSEWAQGSSNQSHGCVNVSSANAAWFYSTFDAGDVVEIVNTGLPLGLTDGLGDWTVSWDQWKKGSALAT